MLILSMAHQHHHHHHHENETEGSLKTAFNLNLFFTIFEIFGGIFTNSFAIVADAIHDLGDTVAIGSALWLEKYSQKKRDKNFSYGYRRFSTLSSVIVSTVLIVGSVVIVFQAIPRLVNPEVVHAKGVLLLAIVGVLVNGLAAYKLSKGEHSLNKRAVMLHMLEDVLGWVAVLVGGIIMHFTDWYIIDPILSLGIAIFILYNAIKNMKQSLVILLQAIPDAVNLPNIKKHIESLDRVESCHDLHAWSLDGEKHVLTVHIVIKLSLSPQDICDLKNKIRSYLTNENVYHATIEIENQEEKCGLVNC